MHARLRIEQPPAAAGGFVQSEGNSLLLTSSFARSSRQSGETRRKFRDAARGGSASVGNDNDQRFSTCVSRLARVKVTRREGTGRVEEIGRGRSFYLVGLTRASAPLPTLSHPRAHSRSQAAVAGKPSQSPRLPPTYREPSRL